MTFQDLCRELWCSNSTHALRAHPALEGTDCSSKPYPFGSVSLTLKKLNLANQENGRVPDLRVRRVRAVRPGQPDRADLREGGRQEHRRPRPEQGREQGERHPDLEARSRGQARVVRPHLPWSLRDALGKVGFLVFVILRTRIVKFFVLCFRVAVQYPSENGETLTVSALHTESVRDHAKWTEVPHPCPVKCGGGTVSRFAKLKMRARQSEFRFILQHGLTRRWNAGSPVWIRKSTRRDAWRRGNRGRRERLATSTLAREK